MKKTSKFLWVCCFILAVANLFGIIIAIAEKNVSESIWAFIALTWLLNFMCEVREKDLLKEEINRLDADIIGYLCDIESHLRLEKEQEETIQELQDEIKHLKNDISK